MKRWSTQNVELESDGCRKPEHRPDQILGQSRSGAAPAVQSVALHEPGGPDHHHHGRIRSGVEAGCVHSGRTRDRRQGPRARQPLSRSGAYKDLGGFAKRLRGLNTLRPRRKPQQFSLRRGTGLIGVGLRRVGRGRQRRRRIVIERSRTLATRAAGIRLGLPQRAGRIRGMGIGRR